MSVGTVSYAAPLASTGVPGTPSAAPATSVAAPVAGQQAVASPNAAVATGYSSEPAASAVVGGGLSQDVGNAVARLATFAQSKMDDVQRRMQGDMASEGGQIDPGKLQAYNMEMSKYEMIMQMAAKIQEKEERAASVWLRP